MTPIALASRLRGPALLAAAVWLCGCNDYELTGLDGDVTAPLEQEPAPPDPPVADTEPDDTGEPTQDTEPQGETGETTDDSPVDDDTGPVSQAGCADGEREGYGSWDDYPSIAACSGAWSVGGVTRPDLAPTCDRRAGDDGALPEGDGCSAADLCAAGWHVCEGHAEVEALAGSCDGAVPDGTPDKSLLFAVTQHSLDGSVCNDGVAEGNDVFGCGNLGTVLTPDKGCGVLNRVLASMHADTCGFNEAEPDLGPWECRGGDDSHLAEGVLVTKVGCPFDSCSYDGLPVGSSDKGGVLCCAG